MSSIWVHFTQNNMILLERPIPKIEITRKTLKSLKIRMFSITGFAPYLLLFVETSLVLVLYRYKKFFFVLIGLCVVCNRLEIAAIKEGKKYKRQNYDVRKLAMEKTTNRNDPNYRAIMDRHYVSLDKNDRSYRKLEFFGDF